MPPKTPKKGIEQDDVSQSTASPADMKVTELREALAARGLPTKGLKKELQERLEGALKSDASAPVDGEIKQEEPEAGKEEDEQVDYSVDEPSKPLEDFNEPVDESSVKTHQPVLAKHEDVLDTVVKTPVVSTSAKALPKEEEMAAKVIEAPKLPLNRTSVLHINGFVRPFTLQQAKDMLSVYGEVLNFWMDSIKTHAFVQFSDQSGADAAYLGINGKIWPAEVGKILSVSFSTEAEMKHHLGTPSTESVNTKQRRSSDNSTSGEPASKKNKGLDELFKKTQAKPHLYYLPAK